MARPPASRSASDVSPGELPDVPPGRTQPHTHDFTLQAVVEMQRTLGEVSAKVDRLISDVSKQGDKVTDLRETVSFVKGAVWVIGILGIIVVPLMTWLLNHAFPAAAGPPATTMVAASPSNPSPSGPIEPNTK